MIILDMPQNTPEWDFARLGIPTASMMSSIITSTGKASTSSKTYMNQLVSDWHAGHKTEAWSGNKFTDIGHEREPEITALYTLLTDNEVTDVGFVFKDETRLVGCSPDGLVNEDGLTEFKNPKGSTMASYAVAYIKDKTKIPSTYFVQVQCQLWVTGREWCDFMVYHPDHGHILFHVKRDESFITTMSGMVSKFNTNMLQARDDMVSVFGQPRRS